MPDGSGFFSRMTSWLGRGGADPLGGGLDAPTVPTDFELDPVTESPGDFDELA